MKKIIIEIVMIILVLVTIIGLFYIFNGSNNSENKFNDNKQNDIDNNINLDGKKILVVYYSAQNHTENIAKKIASKLNADIFEIEPENVYTSSDLNWSDSNSRVSREHNDESLRNVSLKTTKVDDWDSYDIVLIGYPIWWGIAAWPVNTFVQNNDFTGKTVIPFCTSASSGIGESGELLKRDALGGDWKSGYRFSSNATDNDIETFIDSISEN